MLLKTDPPQPMQLKTGTENNYKMSTHTDIRFAIWCARLILTLMTRDGIP